MMPFLPPVPPPRPPNGSPHDQIRYEREKKEYWDTIERQSRQSEAVFFTMIFIFAGTLLALAIAALGLWKTISAIGWLALGIMAGWALHLIIYRTIRRGK